MDQVIQSSLSKHGTLLAVSVHSLPPDQRVSYLAQQFVPQFELAPHELWQRTAVDWYVAHSTLTTSQTFLSKGAGASRGAVAVLHLGERERCAGV
jgi:hypothetical protein